MPFRWNVLFVLGLCQASTIAAATNEEASFFPFTESLVETRARDMQGLFNDWIEPRLTGPTRIAPWDATNTGAAIRELEEGFSTFCRLSEGELSKTGVSDPYTGKQVNGTSLKCQDGIDLVGSLLAYEDDREFRVWWSSALEQARLANARRATQEEFDKLARTNGPTGWITTDSGRNRFSRIGTAVEPHHVLFAGLRPEDIESVTWLKPCCDVSIRLRDGTTKVANISAISRQTAEDGQAIRTGYGLGDSAFPVVEADPDSGKARQMVFPNFEKLRSLVLDPPSQWQHKPSGLLALDRQASESPSMSSYPNRVDPGTKNVASPMGIGSKVCNLVSATARVSRGFAVAGREYFEEVPGQATITAFVEQSSGARIQLRVGGVQFSRGRNGSPIPLSPFNYEGSELSPGVIIWDYAERWGSCY